MSLVKVLVVEDEFIVAADLKARLNKMGYKVVGTAASGLEAIEKVWRESPDIILMDIVLKGDMDGIAAAAAIKQGYNLPIIFLTAYADQNTFKKAKLTEPFGYICKPFQEKNLRMAIEVALQRHSIETQQQQELIAVQQSHYESLHQLNSQTEEVSRTIHELRTPLTTILASIKLLDISKGQTETELQNKYLRLLKSSSTKLENLIEDILLLAKAERKQLRFAPEAIDLARFCRNYLEEIQVSSQTSHRFIFLSPNLPSLVYLDAKILETILSNLLTNAIKYSPPEKAIVLKVEYQKNYLPSLEAQSLILEKALQNSPSSADFGNLGDLKPSDDPRKDNDSNYARDYPENTRNGDYNSRSNSKNYSQQSLEQVSSQGLSPGLSQRLEQDLGYNLEPDLKSLQRDNPDQELQELFSPYIVIQVRDYGIGIPQGEQDLVFETFARCSNVSEVSGTGLGLAIVKHAVELHGGSITFDSTEGLGSTFTVALPCGS
ncbi:MAG: hybrid sensor histidine kinase/response regulator [Coleofasciculaceae cyanobacterium SM2_1_6]|nr:hybrid sensor histidine kinase/response regulator [Coleofasciculaceae cyanobacterium SM2_1_6]